MEHMEQLQENSVLQWQNSLLLDEALALPVSTEELHCKGPCMDFLLGVRSRYTARKAETDHS